PTSAEVLGMGSFGTVASAVSGGVRSIVQLVAAGVGSAPLPSSAATLKRCSPSPRTTSKGLVQSSGARSSTRQVKVTGSRSALKTKRAVVALVLAAGTS